MWTNFIKKKKNIPHTYIFLEKVRTMFVENILIEINIFILTQ